MNQLTLGAALLAAALLQPASARAAGAPAGPPVLIGLDLELGHRTSTSGEAIRRGVEIAVEEVNAAGGVLGGRPLALVALDNRSVTARGLENVRTLAANPDVVAVFCGKFSPIPLEAIPLYHALELPLLDPWAAADGIIDHGRTPSYTFRLSLRDGWAMRTILAHAARRGFRRVGLLLPNTSWGRSNEAAAARLQGDGGLPAVVATRWFNWGVDTLLPEYEALRAAGAQAIVFVTNEAEGSLLVRELAARPAEERLPLLAHHGIAGGDLVRLAGPALADVDLSVVQFFTFADSERPRARALLEALRRKYGVQDAAHAVSAGGIAAAYDLTHLLARAIDLAGSADRGAVRAALERLRDHDGAVKRLPRPFTPEDHEALEPGDLFMARFDGDGRLVRIR